MRFGWLLAAVLTLAACGPKATPVTPAPLSAAEQSELGKSIRGTWKCTHTKVGDDGEKNEQPMDVVYAFNADGTYRLVIHGGPFGMDKTYKFHLDGKNVTTDSPHGTYRVDDVTASSMDLFNYDATTTWYLQRVDTKAAQ
jgi:ABC-type glycerol-3-phosphate transport system substrate-binding protein